ncbi:hypothetical protein TNCV_1982481 [Trichonephila clavipes]|nr:hypothetical protein TNCV_1982481 [Trichonephila clavipes]
MEVLKAPLWQAQVYEKDKTTNSGHQKNKKSKIVSVTENFKLGESKNMALLTKAVTKRCVSYDLEQWLATPGLDGYLLINQSSSDGENETVFYDVSEGIIEEPYDELFMLSNRESS